MPSLLAPGWPRPRLPASICHAKPFTPFSTNAHYQETAHRSSHRAFPAQPRAHGPHRSPVLSRYATLTSPTSTSNRGIGNGRYSHCRPSAPLSPTSLRYRWVVAQGPSSYCTALLAVTLTAPAPALSEGHRDSLRSQPKLLAPLLQLARVTGTVTLTEWLRMDDVESKLQCNLNIRKRPYPPS